MKRSDKIVILISVMAGVGLFLWLRSPAGEPAVPEPGDRSPQGIANLQAYPEPATATPAPSGGIFPTPDPDFLPSEIITDYDDFGAEYAPGLATAEAWIEAGAFSAKSFGEVASSFVGPCDAADGYGFYPSSPSAKAILVQLLTGGGPAVVQGVYRDGEDVFTMLVTGLTSAEVDWPNTPTPVPTPTGTATPGGFIEGPSRRPVLEHVPAEGYAIGVSMIVGEDYVPTIQGLYTCELGYYLGIDGLFYGWNIESKFYARD